MGVVHAIQHSRGSLALDNSKPGVTSIRVKCMTPTHTPLLSPTLTFHINFLSRLQGEDFFPRVPLELGTNFMWNCFRLERLIHIRGTDHKCWWKWQMRYSIVGDIHKFAVFYLNCTLYIFVIIYPHYLFRAQSIFQMKNIWIPIVDSQKVANFVCSMGKHSKSNARRLSL